MHQQPPNPHEPGTALILGAVTDFVHFLNQQESPIVVGLDYKPDRIVDAMKAWTEERNVSLESINRPMWIEGCKQGLFRGKDT